ncbi:uncharacterized protein N7503_001777 [Penicillium pulvis]|uniref:uncharacterized protein n=1 Tax=Penicillium pulvis TaxID=1562058 RepID=UPI00254682D2|nr:uncharacterized protein N7503_001777 [Penicillium pulvis]KAJ5809559.1 hypothetical protein N7503_001777 [Penicillium pulvis]
MTNICYEYHLVVSEDTCALIASEAGISLSDFESWNPAVGTNCTDLDIGDYVCIRVLGYGYSSATPTSSSLRLVVTTTPTSTGTGVSTPSPIQTGMVSTCDLFHLVVSGDTCAVIAKNEDISLTDFYSWNPAVGSSCAYLDLGDYVCVGVIGSTATTTTTATATTTTSGITTPSPVQTGMVSDCDAFYYVVDGDGCSGIATAEGVSVADLELWNPAIGADCTDLWLDTYICVGIS